MNALRELLGFRARPSLPFALVALVAIAVGLPFFIVQPIVFTNDSVGYIEGARAMIGAPEGRYPYWRTPLYPFLMALTGAGQQWSLRPLVLMQFLLGLSMPMLVYFSLKDVSRWLAAAAGVAVSVSLTPFAMVGYVMPNQLYYFMVVLAMYFTFRFITAGNDRDLYAIALTGFAAVMVRPQGSYLYLFLMALALIAAPRRWKHCIAATVIAIALQFTYMGARPYFAHAIAPTDEVLLSDLKSPDIIPDDNVIYRRGLLFIRNNFIDDGLTIANFIGNRKLAGEVRLAAYLQSLLIKDPARAERDVLAEPEQSVRDLALSFLARTYATGADMAAARRVLDGIASTELRAETTASLMAPFQVPILTVAAPADGRLEPRPYVNSFDLTDVGGKMMLTQVFMTRKFFLHARISPDNGPATEKLYWILNQYILGPRIFEHVYPNLSRFISHPAQGIGPLLNNFGDHELEAHWTVWQMLDRLIGPSAANRLLGQVVLEFARRYPLELGEIYLKSFVQAFIGRPMAQGAVLFGFPSHPAFTVVPRFRSEIAASNRFLASYKELNQFVTLIFPNVNLLMTIIAALGILVIRSRALFVVWGTCWIIAVHQVGVCMLTVGTGYLYTSLILVPLIIASCITVFAATRRIQAIRR